MNRAATSVATVADAYLRLLAGHGVDYLFCNAGTDFAPLIEAYAKAEQQGDPVPRPIAVAHENAAVAMAHGHTMVSGRPQAVMAHVSVGTANMICGVTNAARAQIPMLVTAGRTPITESAELPGSRNYMIHWAQEMFDQAAMMREHVKWDYELKNATQVGDVVTRAVEVASTEPCGPVYLSLPREVLAQPCAASVVEQSRRALPGIASAANADLEQLADWLAAAEFPLIITTSLGRHPESVDKLAALAAQ